MITISTLYPDLDLTNFPDSVDTQQIMVDPSPLDLTAIQQYMELYNSGNIAGANAVLEANPQLKNMLVNAAKMNRLEQMIIALQRFYFDDFDEWLVNAADLVADTITLDGYEKPETAGDIETTDTINEAIGKLDKRFDNFWSKENLYVGEEEPSDEMGQDGDIYFQIIE